MIASSTSPLPPSPTSNRKESRTPRPPHPQLDLEQDLEPTSTSDGDDPPIDVDSGNGAVMEGSSGSAIKKIATEHFDLDAEISPDVTDAETLPVVKTRQRSRSALADLGTRLNTAGVMPPRKDKLQEELDLEKDSDNAASMSDATLGGYNGDVEEAGGHRNPAEEIDGVPDQHAGVNSEQRGHEPSISSRQDGGITVEQSQGDGINIDGVSSEDPGETRANGATSSRAPKETSPRRNRDKEKILKLSPAKMQELMSSPESIPYRRVPLQQHRVKTVPLDIPSLALRSGLDGLGEDSSRSAGEMKTPNNFAAKMRRRKDLRLADPPEFLGPVEETPLSAPLRPRPQASRTVSTPSSTRRLTSSVSHERLSHTWASRSKQDRSFSHRIDLDPKTTLHPSKIADPTPSPMPQSIPLPPLSIPTYLQLELSSTRPSPLYIHRSVTSDFPYESSRVKMERLLNFFMLPAALEQVLWFGALTCLDSWLYSFTILPLRFVKALYILFKSWAINLGVEIRFISGFIVKGIGRVWRRRNISAEATPEQRGTEETSGPRAASSGSFAKNEAFQFDRDARNRSAISQPEGGRRPRRSVSHRHRRQRSIPSALLPDDKADILKGLLMISTCLVLMRFDASRMYHWIRGQAAIKLYVIYNVLEVSDRLFSAIGQDVLECLFSREALERKPDGRSKVLRPFWLFIIALVYTVVHATSLFYQVMTLNVAVNSYSNALITLLLSNQFVEIKSTVFKKFEKENLFQLTCADVVERFQLWLMLIIIASRNIVETGVFSFWGSLGSGFSTSPSASTNSTPLSTPPRTSSSILPQSFTLFPSSLFASLSSANSVLPMIGQVLGPFLVVLGSEMIVDWLKHAYINKFNNTRPAIYGRFLDVLAKDYYTNAFAEQNLTRRLGLPVIPLSCLFFRVSVQTYQMFLTAWLPQHPSPPPDTTSLSSIHRHYASSPSPSSPPLTFKSAIPYSFNHIASFLNSVVANATPSPARSVPVFTIILIIIGYIMLLLFKLALGIVLLSFARSRYKAMKNREQEELLKSSNGSVSQKPSASRGMDHVVEGSRRVGGWGVVEVDDDKRRWIYADDPEELRKLKEKEEKAKSGKDGGTSIEGVKRYEMVAKRIW
ncbi:hypothetical protein VTN00DRAFT_4865 [Thermoascus crustaceus]|uniref:uncharacterized protein n=1 Tax=Thermoascus crustaceus TaxID=5088 RepID=UPI0037438A70